VPKVDSAFVSLDFAEGIRQCQGDDEWFEAVVRVAFSQRRKQLRNLLKGFPAQMPFQSGQENGEISALKDIDWSEILEEVGIEPTDRAENVSPEKFLALSRRIKHVFRAG
jgi:16S rRNA A1518/A1519 N6-dimethyltransferase RsmA/KsgA/DIM1 with predicted DNA glycosylase/AP lyase activity